MNDRKRHQQRVEALLDAIDERRHEARVRAAGGVQPAGLRDLKIEIESARTELAAAIGAAASVSS
jgi:hypothetical protein